MAYYLDARIVRHKSAGNLGRKRSFFAASRNTSEFFGKTPTLAMQDGARKQASGGEHGMLPSPAFASVRSETPPSSLG
jgi:hypothetical protein